MIATDLELVASDLQFPEGPVTLGDGSVLVVEMRRGTLTRVRANGDAEVVAEPGGGPNGAALGPGGAVYICNNGGRFSWVEKNGRILPGRKSPDHVGGSIQRVDLRSGAVETLFSREQGADLVAPNDLVVDKSGGIWFTDHGGHEDEWLRYGALYYARPGAPQPQVARKSLITPNGVGLSPDEKTLYFSETLTGRLWSFPVDRPGVLAAVEPRPGRVLATLPDYQRFDSLAVEADGRVCVATIGEGGIAIVGMDGSVDRLPLPDSLVTNIAFGGPDMRDAWITCSGTGTLYKCRWPRPGHRLNFAT